MLNKWWFKGGVIALGLALIGVAWSDLANAAPPAPTVTVTWARTTAFTDGTPLAAGTVVNYQLYVGPSGAETVYGALVTSPPYVLKPNVAPGAKLCVQVTASVTNFGESARSQEVCATMPSAPAPPTHIVMTVK